MTPLDILFAASKHDGLLANDEMREMARTGYAALVVAGQKTGKVAPVEAVMPNGDRVAGHLDSEGHGKLRLTSGKSEMSLVSEPDRLAFERRSNDGGKTDLVCQIPQGRDLGAPVEISYHRNCGGESRSTVMHLYGKVGAFEEARVRSVSETATDRATAERTCRLTRSMMPRSVHEIVEQEGKGGFRREETHLSWGRLHSTEDNRPAKTIETAKEVEWTWAESGRPIMKRYGVPGDDHREAAARPKVDPRDAIDRFYSSAAGKHLEKIANGRIGPKETARPRSPARAGAER